MSVEYYSGEVSAITRHLQSLISVGTGEADDLDPDEIPEWQQEADDEIDAILSQCYYTPLRKVPRKRTGGDVTWVYPEQVVESARQLVVAKLISAKYRGSQFAGSSEVAKATREEAIIAMSEVVNDTLSAGSSILRGQKLRGRNRFVRPQITPSSPGTPTQGGAGGIGIG